METKEKQIRSKTFYYINVKEDELVLEIIHLKAYLSALEISEFSIFNTYKRLESDKYKKKHFKRNIIRKFLLMILITNCKVKRLFFKFNLIKEEIKHIINHKRFNCLSYVSIKNKLLSSLDYKILLKILRMKKLEGNILNNI